MSDEDAIELHRLTREELQDLIDDMELDITVDDLMHVIELLADSDNLDLVRNALTHISKAA